MYIKDFINDLNSDEFHRYRSFDYCYTYFHHVEGHASNRQNMIQSCYILWSYLASWGMLRGSSKLLQKNPYFLQKVITEIDNCQHLYTHSVYDVDHYNDDTVCIDILIFYERLKEALVGVSPTGTLITKIMLGTVGCVPALDIYLKKALGISGNDLTASVLQKKIYPLVKEIDLDLDIKALDYMTNCPGNISYTKAKLLDMYGFMKGQQE